MQKNQFSQPGPSQPNDVDKRLSVLEERLTFMEHTLDDLGGVLTATQAQLDRLEGKAEKLQAHLQRLSDLSRGEDLPHEKPPHY